MKRSGDLKTFGERVRDRRQARDWTIKDLIQKLQARGQKSVSPAYITRVEQYGEIPSPEFICLLADVLDDDPRQLLECARNIKVTVFDRNLEEKYQKAAGHYRVQKGKQRKSK